jgi:hypothetical protein
MEHSLHLGAGHFVRGVAPTSSRKILKKVQYEDGDNAAADDDSEDEFEAADSIGKVLVLVNQVSILIFRTFLHLTASLGRSASHRKLEPFSKSHVRRWMLRVFILNIGSGPDGVHCSTFLIESSPYNRYVSTLHFKL